MTLISHFRLCGAPGKLCGFVVPELIKRKTPIDLPVVFEVNGDLDGEDWVSLSTVFVAQREGPPGHGRGGGGGEMPGWLRRKGCGSNGDRPVKQGERPKPF